MPSTYYLRCSCSASGCKRTPQGFTVVTRNTFARHAVKQAILDNNVEPPSELNSDSAEDQDQLGDVNMPDERLAYEEEGEAASNRRPSSDEDKEEEDNGQRPRITNPLHGINMDDWDTPIHEGGEDDEETCKLGEIFGVLMCVNESKTRIPCGCRRVDSDLLRMDVSP